MKKVNFRSIEEIKVSDELNKRLLSIPERQAEKPFYRRPRYIAAAAVLVAVAGSAAALFALIGGRQPAAVMPSVEAPTQSFTEHTAESQPASAVQAPTAQGTEKAAQSSTAAAVQPTLSGSDTPTEQTATAYRSPGEGAVTSPIQAQTDVEHATAQPVTEASVTEPSATQPPASAPTEAPTEAPTDKYELAPTAKWVNYLSQQTLSGIIQESMLTGSGKVYFRIYAFDGSPLGAEDLFADSNRAKLTPNRYNTVTASYYLGLLADDLANIQKGDCLTYCFFNEDGEQVYCGIKVFNQ
ncbi:MAG: hypothetical protein IJU73_03150 [Ruminococcus sp.]|nr:hypothetical protein [Ruminococcus sp.]